MMMPTATPFIKSAATALAAVFLGSLTCCGEITTTPHPVDPEKKYIMQGVITSDNLPLAGVLVSGGTDTVSSDATGNYLTNLPPGESTVLFTKAGYEQVSKLVATGTEPVIQVDIAMTLQSGGGGEYVYRKDHYVEFPINTASGWAEFDVTLAESGRANDWYKVAIISIYDGQYHGATNGLVDLRPYKLKWCYATTCKEPRYNLPWDTWRHVRLEWTTTEVWATIDGTKVGGTLVGPFTPGGTRLMIGDHPRGRGVLAGGRMKNLIMSK